tara:strand:- start:5878 stop:6660 length:783 start_codon:yes stop_codon:yes gene_type:complete
VRTVSALLLISFTIPIVLLSPSWFFALFVFFMCSIISYEYNKLSKKIFPNIFSWDITLDVTLLIFFFCYTSYSWYLLLIYLSLQTFFKLFFSDSIVSGFLSLGGVLLGVVWIALPGIVIIFIEKMEFGRLLIISLLIITWSNDIFAYLVGKNIGKTKLLPSISPNKTVEGSIAGLIGGVISGILLFKFLPLYRFDLTYIFFISLILSIFGQFGDLCESAFKRNVKVKDSSNLIPGHGGFFDRLDSFLFAVPILYIFLKIL